MNWKKIQKGLLVVTAGSLLAGAGWTHAQQSRYTKVWDAFDDQIIFDIAFTPGDSGILAVGTADEFLSPDFNWYIVKLDKNGNFVWNMEGDPNNGNDEELYFVEPTSDGGFITGGRLRIPGPDRGFVMKFDQNGVFQWGRMISSPGGTVEFRGGTQSGGSYFFIGTYNNAGGGTGFDVLFLKVNPGQGTQIAIRYDANNNGDEFGYDIVIDPATGDAIVVGWGDSWTGTDDIFVLSLDSGTGGNNWSRYYTVATHDLRVWRAYALGNGRIALAGWGVPAGGAGGGDVGVFLVVDATQNGAIVAGRLYSAANSDVRITDVTLSASGTSFVLTGWTNANGGDDWFLIEVDATTFAIKKAVLLNLPGDELLYPAIYTDVDGGYVIGGRADGYGMDDGTLNADLMLVKVDSTFSSRCGVINFPVAELPWGASGNANLAFAGTPGILTYVPSINFPAPFSANPYCVCPLSASFTSSAPACTGDTVFFTYTGTQETGLFFSWNFGQAGSPATSTQQNPWTIFTQPGNHLIELVVSDGVCSDTAYGTADIEKTPVVQIAATQSQFCELTTVQFWNNGDTGQDWTFQWDFGASAIPSTSSSQTPSVVFTAPGNYIVSLTVSGTMCFASDTFLVSVQDAPVATFTHPVRVCQYDTITIQFTGEAQANATYSWMFSNATPSTSNLQNPQVTFTRTDWQNIQLIVTNPNGCADTAQSVILVDSTPVATFTSTAPVCAGTPVNFMNTGTSGNDWTYEWDFGADATPSFSIQENPSGVIFATGKTKTITFIIRNPTTGCWDSTVQTIWIDTLPFAYAGKDTTICFGTSVQIGSPPPAGTNYAYEWRPVETLNDPSLPQPVATPDASQTWYFLVVTDPNTGCVNRDSILVTMLEPIRVEAGPDAEICFGDTVQLSATFDERYAYVWSPAVNISDPNVADPYVWPETTIIYTITVIDTSQYACGSASDQITVIVHPLPTIITIPRIDTIARGESVQIVVSGGVQYEWSPVEGLSHWGVPDPVASPDSTTIYVVKVTDVYGCVNYDTVIIYVETPVVWVPDVFTPNGDGINDEFWVHVLGAVSYELRIFDRWGNLVFVSNDPGIRWDGNNYVTGEPEPAGAYVYYYRVELSDGQVVEGNGIVNLIR